jgi:cyclopropane fatty-acyl-phospholipid synthase-like methyltransferase
VELDLGRGVVAHVSNRAVFVPTPYDVVEKMMDAANVGKDDVVYDLGSGDGRILVSAARRGARATGIEIDPDLVRISRENAARAGFADRVRIEPADLLTAEMSTASVVALYLPESFLERLKPKFAGLKPGTRIVSHQVRIPKVRVDGERTFESPEDGVLHRLYLYTCPLTEVP